MSNKVIHLPKDSIDVCIVPCDNCGQKLKVPKNDRMLRVKCPSCKNTFAFQNGEKVQEIIEKTWWQKNLYLLIGVAIACLLAIPIILFSLPENKQKPPPPMASPLPTSPQIIEKPLKKYPQDKLEAREWKKFEALVEKPVEKSLGKYPPPPVVPVEPTNPKRLPNGSSPYGPGIRSGHSTLTVDNGTDTDAFIQVIRLLDKKQRVRNFYIQSNSKWTETWLPPGQYVIREAFGKDWNSKFRKFNFRRSFSETEEIDISETTSVRQTEDGQQYETEYIKLSITLHKVPFGKFKSHGISEEEFMKTLSDFREEPHGKEEK